MKKCIRTILTVGFSAALAATTAFGQNMVISVDEWGVGYANGVALPSQLAQEPWSGITTVAYTLPFPAVPGDVQLIEPDGTTSDLLRFDANSHLFFFSDWAPGDPPDAPADVGIPSPVAGLTTVYLPETGTEGVLDGYWGYNPNPNGDPGANSAGAIYNFISDVPEPGALPLLAVGLGIIGFIRQRQKLSRT
jgi:hypothetical protein